MSKKEATCYLKSGLKKYNKLLDIEPNNNTYKILIYEFNTLLGYLS